MSFSSLVSSDSCCPNLFNDPSNSFFTMVNVHVITQGCSANQADSEVMKGLLAERGDALVSTEGEADVVVINSCTVKGPTETAFRRKLAELDSLGKKVVVAGCIPQAGGKGLDRFSRIGTYQIERIGEAVSETANGNIVTFLEREDRSRLNLPKVRNNQLIEIVPISHGCLSHCTYCKTKYARGQLYSYRPRDIISHIEKAVRDGAKEVWLTSQDSSAYGLDINSNLAELLSQIVAIPHDFRLRLGMSNPLFFEQFLPAFVGIFRHPKIYKFLHVPLQAGNNHVLEKMKRGYTVEDFFTLVAAVRRAVPELTLSTDIICGFPGETDEQFADTITALRRIQPDVINISKFWPRPGTAASHMEKVSGHAIKSRSKAVHDLFHRIALENNRKWVGWEGNVLISEVGKAGTMLGRNYCYKQVVVHGNPSLLGKELRVMITDASAFDLKGMAIREEAIAAVSSLPQPVGSFTLSMSQCPLKFRSQ